MLPPYSFTVHGSGAAALGLVLLAIRMRPRTGGDRSQTITADSSSEKGGCCGDTDGGRSPSLRASVTPTGGLRDEEPDEGDRGGAGVRLLQGEGVPRAALQRGRAEARLEDRTELESRLSALAPFLH